MIRFRDVCMGVRVDECILYKYGVILSIIVVLIIWVSVIRFLISDDEIVKCFDCFFLVWLVF